MSYATRSCAVIDFFAPIVCHVIQREYRYNMVYVDVGVVWKVKFFDSKVVTKIPDWTICLEDINHYYDVISISIVEMKEKQCNDNDSTIFSIKIFGKNINKMKLYNQLTIIVLNDWTCTLFAICLCKNVMENNNTLFDHLNPEKDDSIGDIPGLNTLYKESSSKLIFDVYSSLAKYFVNGGKHWWMRSFNNIYSEFII